MDVRKFFAFDGHVDHKEITKCYLFSTSQIFIYKGCKNREEITELFQQRFTALAIMAFLKLALLFCCAALALASKDHGHCYAVSIFFSSYFILILFLNGQ